MKHTTTKHIEADENLDIDTFNFDSRDPAGRDAEQCYDEAWEDRERIIREYYYLRRARCAKFFSWMADIVETQGYDAINVGMIIAEERDHQRGIIVGTLDAEGKSDSGWGFTVEEAMEVAMVIDDGIRESAVYGIPVPPQAEALSKSIRYIASKLLAFTDTALATAAANNPGSAAARAMDDIFDLRKSVDVEMTTEELQTLERLCDMAGYPFERMDKSRMN